MGLKLFTSTTRKFSRAVFSHHNCMNTHFAELAHTRPFYRNPGHANYWFSPENYRATRLCPHVILCRFSKEVRLRSGTGSVATE